MFDGSAATVDGRLHPRRRGHARRWRAGHDPRARASDPGTSDRSGREDVDRHDSGSRGPSDWRATGLAARPSGSRSAGSGKSTSRPRRWLAGSRGAAWRRVSARRRRPAPRAERRPRVRPWRPGENVPATSPRWRRCSPTRASTRWCRSWRLPGRSGARRGDPRGRRAPVRRGAGVATSLDVCERRDRGCTRAGSRGEGAGHDRRRQNPYEAPAPRGPRFDQASGSRGASEVDVGCTASRRFRPPESAWGALARAGSVRTRGIPHART